jgi:DNA-binding LacI/PurR family transcriptional regulator
MPSSHPTIRDVGDAAGVGIGTVSRVLNGSGPVSPATARQVRAAVERLGYVPSDAGRTLRTGASRVVGVLVPTISNPIFARSLEGIEAVLHARGYAAFLMSTGYDAADEARALSMLAARGVDGLIATLARADAAPGVAMPMVLLYNRPDGTDGSAALATVDSRGAVRLATARAIALGHRRIAFLGGHFAASDRSAARAEGYGDAMEAAGLPAWPPEQVAFEDEGPAFDAAIARLLDRLNRPTALICSNDLLALATIAALRRAGLDVPGDVSVIGFDGMPAAALVAPPLTTVRQPARSMGRAAAEMLLDMLGGAPARRIVMPTEFLDGGTLARPREVAGPIRAGSASAPRP